jgi:hypothetical protein
MQLVAVPQLMTLNINDLGCSIAIRIRTQLKEYVINFRKAMVPREKLPIVFFQTRGSSLFVSLINYSGQ